MDLQKDGYLPCFCQLRDAALFIATLPPGPVQSEEINPSPSPQSKAYWLSTTVLAAPMQPNSPTGAPRRFQLLSSQSASLALGQQGGVEGATEAPIALEASGGQYHKPNKRKCTVWNDSMTPP